MATVVADEGAPAPVPERGRSVWLTIGKWALGILAALALLIAGGIAFLDSNAGHRLITDRIAALAPGSGLRFRVGRIEGSIFGRATLRDVRLYDTRGLFLAAPTIELDWRPAAYLYNELWIETLDARLVRLERLPVFNPSEEDGPVLPDLDIHIGRLDIRRLELGREVAGGEERVGRVRAQADIRAGRALVDLQALVQGGDRLALRLDAEPDRDRFDLDARLAAPADGVASALLGTDAPFELQVSGDGRWTQWNGTALLDWRGRRSANLALRNRAGRYELSGAVAPQAWLTGRPAALLGPRLLVNAQGTFAERRLDGRVSIQNPNLRGEARGVVDLAQSRFEGVDMAVRLVRPEVFVPTLRTEDLRLVAMLDGSFRRARFGFRATEPALAFGSTGVRGLSVQGSGQLGADPFRIPVSIRASAVTGVGEVAGGLLTNVRIDGTLTWVDQTITSNDLAFRSDRLNGRAVLLYDIASGRYQLTLSGTLNRYAVSGLGIVDVAVSNVRVVNSPAGPRVLGRARVVFRRLDNAFFRNLAGGLPVIDADFERTPDGFTYFRNARVRAPGLNLVGNGFLRPNGTIRFEGSGRSREYGAFRLVLDGPLNRPAVGLQLANPLASAGLAGVRLQLTPNARGFAFTTAGQSILGPFTARGQIVLGGQTRFEIAELRVAGTTARGVVTPVTGGLAGRLLIAGGGLDGTLDLSVVGGRQRIEAHLTANNARFPGPPPIAIREGRIDGAVILNPDGPTAEGRISLRGVQRGTLLLSSLEATGTLRGGRGTVQANFAGRSGNQRFQFATVANFAPRRVEVTGQGTVNGRPARLTRPAVLVREGADWRLLPTQIAIEGGVANIAGTLGGARTEINARLRDIRLSVLEIVAPDLGLGGVMSGTVNYVDGVGDPTGRVNLRVRNLTRTGLVLASRPVDVGLAAVLGDGRLGARAVFNSGGQTIGRAQMLVRGYAGPGAFVDRLLRAPLQAQVRYSGAADTLWRLTTVELIDLSGPVTVGADVGGSLRNPQIRGAVRSDRLRLESPITGTVLSNLQVRGRFGGSQLILDSFTGQTPGDGTVTGRGTFDLAAANGFGIDLALQANRARLLDRDDVAAAVTGPILIRSDGRGGTISGNLAFDRGRFTLGRATAARAIPRLNVREVGRVADEDDIVLAGEPPLPWTLDLKVQGDNRLTVNGLGLDSEWGLDVAITGPVDAFRLSGRADFVRGGYEFAGKRFDITQGTIRFVGNSPIDPLIDIRAEADVQGLNAAVVVRGTGLAPEIAFTSNPALPQDELLSRILFGQGIATLSAPEAIQLAAAVASLQGGGGGLDPIGAIRRAIGLDRFRIVPGDVAARRGTSIAAGKYITRRVFAEIVTDGQGYSATTVEYRITRFLTVLAQLSSRGRAGANVRYQRDY